MVRIFNAEHLQFIIYFSVLQLMNINTDGLSTVLWDEVPDLHV